MLNESFDAKLPKGFNYTIKNDEMVIHFYCDCCTKEIKVSKKLKEGKEEHCISFLEIFTDLKKELDGKFYRCEKCGFLICQKCWDSKETRCSNCSICITRK
ncbi:MAG: hypothetical protein JXA54_02895 [Candidatus Heimdallarchaeota archaeon]|nr:hypothetical protein [Candidatus Heimdallarchaeota archaeon]